MHRQTKPQTRTICPSTERQHAGFRVYKRLFHVWSCSESSVCTAGNKFQVSVKSFTVNSFSLKSQCTEDTAEDPEVETVFLPDTEVFNSPSIFLNNDNAFIYIAPIKTKLLSASQDMIGNKNKT